MKTVARYLDNANTSFDGSYVSTLIKPTHIFVNGVVAYDPAEARADGRIQLGPTITNFTLVDERKKEIPYTRACEGHRVRGGYTILSPNPILGGKLTN